MYYKVALKDLAVFIACPNESSSRMLKPDRNNSGYFWHSASLDVFCCAFFYLTLCLSNQLLPSPVPVACGIPNQLFGDFVCLLEFINSFSDVLELTDVYPQGITFEMLENAMVTKEVAGQCL